jgi:hypothetical protein
MKNRKKKYFSLRTFESFWNQKKSRDSKVVMKEH